MARGGSKPGERRGGRQKGTPNKSNADLRAIIDAVADPEALVKELARIASEGEREETRVTAITQLLDRRYGRPRQAVEVDAATASHVTVSWEDSTEALMEKLARLANDGQQS
jgi:hypothetical protein